MVLAAIVGGFFVVGSPAKQRDRRFDERRVNDLQVLQSEVVNYWNQKDTLPANLSDLASSITGFIPPTDPETSQSYEYSRKSDLAFALCANFNLANTYEDGKRAVPMMYPQPYYQNWSHGAGRVCFDRTLDPERDKLISPTQALPK